MLCSLLLLVLGGVEEVVGRGEVQKQSGRTILHIHRPTIHKSFGSGTYVVKEEALRQNEAYSDYSEDEANISYTQDDADIEDNQAFIGDYGKISPYQDTDYYEAEEYGSLEEDYYDADAVMDLPESGRVPGYAFSQDSAHTEGGSRKVMVQRSRSRDMVLSQLEQIITVLWGQA